jgi:uncharacterized protein with NRDE domain
MCILFVAVNQHKDYPLIIAANRDEFFERPTSASSFWDTQPNLLAGKDDKAGGTWMGITSSGRLAALTNIRDPQKINPEAATRGELVRNYLQGTQHTDDYLNELQHNRANYNGYNLLFGPWQNLSVYNNHLNQTQELGSGVYGLSNASLNSPWPKINKGTFRLEEYCHDGHPIETDKLFALLRDSTQAADAHLPQTGVPLDWERRLSSIFILGKDYGTRSSTVLLIDKNQHVTWQERSFDNNTVCIAERKYNFNIN